MVHRTFKGLEFSALGFGAMRLPVINGDDGKIDEKAAFEMIDYAMSHGINYYDTAWPYHNGNSEIVLGKALKRYDRKSFYLATKFPGGNLANMDKVEEIFEKQLEKLQVDYFDFYLFHNVCERNIDAYLDPQYGIYEYLISMRNAGKIHHLGFSAHGDLDVLKRFLDAYGSDMEFCQIQLNYIDWELQKAKTKVELLSRYNIPVWVMEPLRGGRLAKIDEMHINKLKLLRPDETIPAWGFRFLQSLPEVKMILSGMSNMEQLKDNIATFEVNRPLDAKENEALLTIARKMTSEFSVPCTSCHYCTNQCPKGLDIPMLLSLYNDHSFSKGGFVAPMVISTMPKDKIPSVCIGCRSCEAICPQQIKISEVMADFTKKLKL